MTTDPTSPPTNPKPARPGFFHRLMGSTARIVGGCVLVVLACICTLGFLKGYIHARRQVTPIIVTPDIAYESVANPPLWDILARMEHIFLVKTGRVQEDGPKLVAFTFDDGPYALQTPQLLDVLKRHGVHATFFVIGKDAQMQPELLRRIVSDGHELGNHSYTHPSFIGLDEAGITRELQQTERLIRDLTGLSPPIMRPPGGRLDGSRYALVHRLGYTVVNYTDNTGDYREANALRIYTNLLMHSSRGAVVLMHQGALSTVRALPTVIAAYRAKGYKFVTISELAKAEGIVIPPLRGASAQN